MERIRFATDMAQVIVSIRVDKDLGPFLDENAEFWIVKPQITARGVSGLQTVLSGSYIEGSWDDQRGTPQRQFEGLAQPPLYLAGEEGLEIVLRAPQGGQLASGAPVFFRGVRVGHISEPGLTASGDAVEAQAFIMAPHDRLITTGTRFWDVSGFSVGLGAGGVSLDVESIATLIEGGVSFSTVRGFAVHADTPPEGADLIVTIGGASVGDHDLVAGVAADLGMEQAFYKVAMRPGKPLMAGRLNSVPMVGLPGNPVSAMVCGTVFLTPMLNAMLGLEQAETPRVSLPLSAPLAANGPREHYMRAHAADDGVTIFDRQDSALLTVLANANCLAVRPIADSARKAGDSIEVIRS